MHFLFRFCSKFIILFIQPNIARIWCNMGQERMKLNFFSSLEKISVRNWFAIFCQYISLKQTTVYLSKQIDHCIEQFYCVSMRVKILALKKNSNKLHRNITQFFNDIFQMCKHVTRSYVRTICFDSERVSHSASLSIWHKFNLCLHMLFGRISIVCAFFAKMKTDEVNGSLTPYDLVNPSTTEFFLRISR